MTTVILVIHLLLAIGLVATILLQRSEGGALGIGGGGGGGLMSSRGAGNALTRSTSILGAAFFLTTITLAILAGTGDDGSVANTVEVEENAPPIAPPLVPPDE